MRLVKMNECRPRRNSLSSIYNSNYSFLNFLSLYPLFKRGYIAFFLLFLHTCVLLANYESKQNFYSTESTILHWKLPSGESSRMLISWWSISPRCLMMPMWKWRPRRFSNSFDLTPYIEGEWCVHLQNSRTSNKHFQKQRNSKNWGLPSMRLQNQAFGWFSMQPLRKQKEKHHTSHEVWCFFGGE